MMAPVYDGFVGIDIAAKTFTPAGPPRPRQFDQTPAGYQAFDQQLRAAIPPSVTLLVVMEATGSYWISLAVFLHHAGHQVAVVNPTHLIHFRKSLPRRAKTDLLDTDLALQFARERQPTPWNPPPTVYHELRQRLVARDALMEMRQQARNQRMPSPNGPCKLPP